QQAISSRRRLRPAALSYAVFSIFWLMVHRRVRLVSHASRSERRYKTLRALWRTNIGPLPDILYFASVDGEVRRYTAASDASITSSFARNSGSRFRFFITARSNRLVERIFSSLIQFEYEICAENFSAQFYP